MSNHRPTWLMPTSAMPVTFPPGHDTLVPSLRRVDSGVRSGGSPRARGSCWMGSGVGITAVGDGWGLVAAWGRGTAECRVDGVYCTSVSAKSGPRRYRIGPMSDPTSNRYQGAIPISAQLWCQLCVWVCRWVGGWVGVLFVRLLVGCLLACLVGCLID